MSAQWTWLRCSCSERRRHVCHRHRWRGSLKFWRTLILRLRVRFPKMLQGEVRPFSTLCWSFKSIALVSTEEKPVKISEWIRKRRKTRAIIAQMKAGIINHLIGGNAIAEIQYRTQRVWKGRLLPLSWRKYFSYFDYKNNGTLRV